MDISFQPKSQVPEESKSAIEVAQVVSGIKGLYVGEHKSIIAIIFTIAPLFAIGGIFALMMVNSSLESTATTLSNAIDVKDKEMSTNSKVPMKDIKQLSDRIQVVSQILKNQAFSTSFLKILEYSVEDEVTFQKTTLSSVTNNANVLYTFNIQAVTSTYASVLSQLQTLQSSAPYNQFFSDIKMSNFDVDKKGLIYFSITGNVSIKGKDSTPEEVEGKLSGKAGAGVETSSNASSSQVTPTP